MNLPAGITTIGISRGAVGLGVSPETMAVGVKEGIGGVGTGVGVGSISIVLINGRVGVGAVGALQEVLTREKIPVTVTKSTNNTNLLFTLTSTFNDKA